jgi:hypothetical protein
MMSVAEKTNLTPALIEGELAALDADYPVQRKELEVAYRARRKRLRALLAVLYVEADAVGEK